MPEYNVSRRTDGDSSGDKHTVEKEASYRTQTSRRGADDGNEEDDYVDSEYDEREGDAYDDREAEEDEESVDITSTTKRWHRS